MFEEFPPTEEGFAEYISKRKTERGPEGLVMFPLSVVSEYANNLPEPAWLLDKIIKPDSLVMLSGPSTISFKTWLVFQMALCIGSGKKCQALNPISGAHPVGIFEQEGGVKTTFGERFGLLSKGSGISLEEAQIYVAHGEPINLKDPRWVESISEWVAAKGLKLIIFDTLARCAVGVDENSSRDMGYIVDGLNTIRFRHNCAVMIVHHVTKAGTQYGSDIDREVRGTSSLAGAADTHIAIRRRWSTRKQKHTNMTVRSNDFEEHEYVAYWDIGDSYGARLELSAVEPGEIPVREYLMYLNEMQPGVYYTQKELKVLWDMAHNSDAGDMAAVLVEKGHVSREEKLGKFKREGISD